MKKSIGLIAVSVLSVVLVFSAVAAYAEEQYQTEVSANYFRYDFDQDARALMYGVNAAVYFEPVKTADHPYALAAFLERIGSVSAYVWNEDSKSGPVKAKGPMYGVSVNYAKPGFPLAIQAMYMTSKMDYKAPFSGSVKTNNYSLSVGNYFKNNLEAGVGYSYSKADFSYAGFSSPSSNTRDYDLFVNYIYELGGSRELAVAGNMGKSRSDDGTEAQSNSNVALNVDYFFTRSLSSGVGVTNRSGKDNLNEGRTYSANVRYFITPRISVMAAYDRFLNANPGLSNNKSFGATIAARF